MALVDLLLPEFDAEIHKTRLTLERLPEDKPDYKPHEKSTPLLKLANHTAEIPAYVSLIMSTDEFDMAKPRDTKPVLPGTGEERLKRFDAEVVTARAALAAASDEQLHSKWRLLAGDRTLIGGTKYLALRNVFFNHMIHHRAQLGLYLRMNDCPVPSIYGPSADES